MDINEKYIELISNEKNIKVNFDEIERIVINRYSICFLPKQITSPMVSISTDYKNEVINELEKINHKSLVTDNSELYK